MDVRLKDPGRHPHRPGSRWPDLRRRIERQEQSDGDPDEQQTGYLPVPLPLLTGIDELLPAGVYNVETDEESLEAISSSAWRRMSTTLHLNAKLGSTVVAQVS